MTKPAKWLFAQRRLRSAWSKDPSFFHVDAQADLSLRWVHMPLCWLSALLIPANIRCKQTAQPVLQRKSFLKFPFKKKGLPSCSASLHVKAKKYTCASDFLTLPRFFVQTLNTMKHFIVNLKRIIVNQAETWEICVGIPISV